MGGGRGHSAVASSEGLLHRASEDGVFLGGDRADELEAVVGLNSDLGEIKATSTEVVEAEGDEPGGVEGGALIGVANEWAVAGASLARYPGGPWSSRRIHGP